MSHHIALTLQIAHEYWGDENVPLEIVPHDPKHFSRLGLLAKRSPARLDVIAETADLTTPQTLIFDVIARDQTLLAVTAGPDWATTPHIDLTHLSENADISLTDVLNDTDSARMPGDPLLRVALKVPVDDTRLVTLHLSAVAALWAYHVTGSKVDDPLQIIDANNEFSFNDLGKTLLPDGTSARVLRSDAPIAMRYRSSNRFTLQVQQDPPFDPITLIPVLPAAGVNLRPTTDPAAAASLQSDIFISLW